MVTWTLPVHGSGGCGRQNRAGVGGAVVVAGLSDSCSWDSVTDVRTPARLRLRGYTDSNMVTDGHWFGAVTVVRYGTTTPIVYYLHYEDAAAAAAFLDGARYNPPRRSHSVRPPTHCDQGTNNSLCRACDNINLSCARVLRRRHNINYNYRVYARWWSLSHAHVRHSVQWVHSSTINAKYFAPVRSSWQTRL